MSFRSVYCVFDKVACEYLPMFESRNDVSAMRSIIASLSQSGVKKYSDYLLVRLATVEFVGEGSDEVSVSVNVAEEGLNSLEISEDFLSLSREIREFDEDGGVS